MADSRQERFTFQEYAVPSERKRIRRLPELTGSAVTLVRRAAPRDLLACVFLQLVMGGALALQLLVLRELLGELLAAERPEFSDLLPELVVLATVGLVTAMMGTFLFVAQRLLGQRVALYATDGVVRTATSVELITYEEPGFHDRLQRAQLSAGSRPAAMVNALIGIVGSVFAIAGIVATLIVIEPVFFLLVFVAFVPAWLVTNRTSGFVYRFTVEQTEKERRRGYLYELLTTKRTAQEIRAFDLGDPLAERQRRIYTELIAALAAVLRGRLPMALTGQAATALLSAGALAVLVWFVTSGRMSLADAGSAAGAMILLTGRLRALAGNVGGIYESSLYLEDFTTFVAAAPRIEAARQTARAERPPDLVVARGVGFTYPSRDTASLVDASLELRRGEVVALVGENGSGKTTFAKLLAGLYAPATGAITWDGVDTARLDPASLREHVAVIFQDFVRYQLSAIENIGFGDPSRVDALEEIERAARAAGIHDEIAALPNGYDTLLGPEFYGGSDLSGGQWQRIALARAFFRDAPIVILDEPTASLDPRAEAEIFERMGELFANRAVLLISHRFGSVRTADRIYVLKDGRVHESGSHDELMAADGYYAELFRMQANLYVD